MRLRPLLPVALVMALLLMVPALPASAGAGAWTRGNQPGGLVQSAALSGQQCLVATGGGLWRSTDTCRHWTLVTALAHRYVSPVVADPKRPGTFYAAADPGGLLRSRDGGATWTTPANQPGFGFYRWLATDPSTPNTVWLVDQDGVPFRNQNSGTGTWNRFDAGLPPNGLNGVVVDPATGDTFGWGSDHVVRLPSAGSTWEDATGNFPPNVSFQSVVVLPEGVVAFTGFGAYDLDTTTPAHWSDFNAGVTPGHLFLGTVDGAGTAYGLDSGEHVWKRGHADSNWSDDDAGLPAGVASGLWADIAHGGHVLAGTAAHPAPDLGQGPLWRTADGGATWARAAGGIQAVEPRSIAVDPHHAGTVLAATVSDGVERSTDGGKTWKSSNSLQVQPQIVVLDPQQPNIALATTAGPGALERSVNGGASWSAVAGQNPSEIAFDDRGIGWELASTEIERSADGGKTWTAYNGLGGLQHQVPSALVPDEEVPGALFAGSIHGVYRLPHKGDTWGRVGLSGDRVYAIAVDGAHPSTVYAGAADGVWRSTNDGLSWHHVLTAPATYFLATAPGHAGVVYASAPKGVRRSIDGGTTWKTLGTFGERPFALAGSADGRTVFAATSGLGVQAWTVPA
ncbi:MAG TPA: hypothetical protein VNN79_19640 [Actinomycetota bacterium]|nr:hypothetical protein [Actinomycetota bacterium]